MAWATGRKYAVVTLYHLDNFIGSGSVWFFFHLEQGGSRNWAITQFFDLLWLVLEVSWCWWVCHSDANIISIKWGSNFTRSQIFYHPGPTWFYSWLCSSLKVVPLPNALLFQSDISHCIVQLKFAKRLDLWLSPSSLCLMHKRPIKQETRCWGKEWLYSENWQTEKMPDCQWPQSMSITQSCGK